MSAEIPQLPLELKGHLVAPIALVIAGVLLFGFPVGVAMIVFGPGEATFGEIIYRLVLVLLALFSTAAGVLMFYLCFGKYVRKTVFETGSMTEHLMFGRARRTSLVPVVSFQEGFEIRRVRGVDRKLHHIDFQLESGEEIRWIPHESDFPINYREASAIEVIQVWMTKLTAIYGRPRMSDIRTINELNAAVRAWGRRLGRELSIPNEAQHDGSIHLEQSEEGEFEIVATERGMELSRDVFRTAEEALAHLFIGLTFHMGVDYELKNRVPKQDFRRIVHQHQLQILADLNPTWKARAQREIGETLSKYPYSDE